MANRWFAFCSSSQRTKDAPPPPPPPRRTGSAVDSYGCAAAAANGCRRRQLRMCRRSRERDAAVGSYGCAAATANGIPPPPPRVLLLCRASPTQPNLAPIQKSLHTRNYDYTLPPWLSRANHTNDQAGTSRYHAIATVRSAITNGQDFSISWY